MSEWGPAEMNSLFCSVMTHHNNFRDVTSDEGAAAFNREFLSAPLPEAEAEMATPITIEAATPRGTHESSARVASRDVEPRPR